MKRIKTVSEKLTSWRWWLEWAGIFIGDAIMAAGFVFFINPYNIIPGGVYGASIVLHNLFPSIQVGTFGYCFDIPLLITTIPQPIPITTAPIRVARSRWFDMSRRPPHRSAGSRTSSAACEG